MPIVDNNVTILNVPHVAGKSLVDDAGLCFLGAPKGQMQGVQQPGQEVDGIALKGTHKVLHTC